MSITFTLTPIGRVALPHADLDALELAIQDALAGGARRVWYAADGVYSMFGDRLDVAGLATLMARYPALHAYLDDAHGMSWAGRRGAGTLFDADLPVDRTIIATSLAKGFGATGGVLVVPDRATKERIENLGPSLMFSIQLPPAVLGAVVASARLHLTDELAAMQAELAAVVDHARARFEDDAALGPRLPVVAGAPTPVLYVTLGAADTVIAAAAELVAAGYLVNPVAFPAVPMDAGGLRITLTRAHRRADVDRLAVAIVDAIAATTPARKAG